MSPSSNDNRPSSSSSDVDLAQAYRDLARGEQAATALEANLANLESKLDTILAALEANSARKPNTKPAKNNTANGSSNGNTPAEKGAAGPTEPAVEEDKA
ncbi:hypothetical protein BGZ63DRAFT_374939 [Mariannaea sp. PMI_226]|nr:hypothetical protein BGZ63DRAFT_374939 [Mariannaea sp. PMI_226]